MAVHLLENRVKEFHRNHVQIGDWRHGWPPFFLHRRWGLSPEEAVSQSSEGANDRGIDAFHIDSPTGSVYLIQGKFAEGSQPVKAAIDKFRSSTVPFLLELVNRNVEGFNLPRHIQKLNLAICGDHEPSTGEGVNSLHFWVLSLCEKDALIASRAILDAKSEFHESDQVQQLATALGIDRGQIVLDMLSHADLTEERVTPRSMYSLSASLSDVDWEIRHRDNRMRLVLVSLRALDRLYKERGTVLYHRNVRLYLGEKKPPSAAIERLLNDILLKKTEDPGVFPFYHSGITLACRD